jgi:chorismate mutase
MMPRMTERLRAIRGATTLDEDTRDQVMERTAELLRTIFERNDLQKSDLVSIIFTATDDVRSEFPAAAARSIGISDVPLLCARELDVREAVTLCVRVLIHAYSTREPSELRHVYLERARPLRTDLPQ